MRAFLMAAAAALMVTTACESIPVSSPQGTASPAPQTSHDAPWREVEAENLVILKTLTGEAVIELAANAAPAHAAQFREAVRANLYNDEFFYRVIDGHVAQAGLEFEHRLGGWAELSLEAERPIEIDGFVPLGNPDLFAEATGHRDGFAVGREGGQEWLLHCPGALGMARDTAPDSGATELYIAIGQRRYLDRNYTLFGRVIAGMDHINRLDRVDPTPEDALAAFLDPETSEEALAKRAERLAANRILSVGGAADMPADIRPRWEVMATHSAEWEILKDSKRDYGAVDAFVVTPPKRLDICTLPVPARQISD